MIVSKNVVYEDTIQPDIITKLKSAILYQLYDKKIKCEEKSDYIRTEIVDIYPREDTCSVVSNPTLDIKFSKEFKYNKISLDTKQEKIQSLAQTIVEKTLNLTVEDLLD